MKYLLNINDFIKEDLSNVDDSIIEQIKRDCKPYLDYVKNNRHTTKLLLKGIQDIRMRKGIINIDDGIFIADNLPKSPLDTDIKAREVFDDIFESIHHIRIREDGVFTTFDEICAERYGRVFIIIPIGDFKYFWNPYIEDFYTEIDETRWYEYLYKNPIAIYQYYFGDPRDGNLDAIANGYFYYKGERLDLDYFNVDDFEEEYNRKDTEWVPDLDEREYEEQMYDERDEHMRNIINGYTNKDLDSVLKEEVILVCDSYYIIDEEYYQLLLQKLFK